MKHKLRPAGANDTSVPLTPFVLTVEQVAQRLQIPPSSVYEKTRFRGANGGTPLPCRKVGRYLRFITSEVDAWLLALPQSTKRTKRRYRKSEAA